MHSSPVLRLATHTDMHAIWQIDADVFGEDVYPGFFFRQAMDLWPELLVVAEREGRLLGYALGGLGQDRSQGWLLSLAVRPEARGFGLAEQMMLQVEQALAHLQVARVRLTVDPPIRPSASTSGWVISSWQKREATSGRARIACCWKKP